MSKTVDRQIWFKTKLYGWGWTPVTWQGWVSILIYILLLLLIVKDVENSKLVGVDLLIFKILPITFITLVLLVVCLLKGEKPRWRWGK